MSKLSILQETLDKAQEIRGGRDDFNATEVVFENLSESDKALWDKEAEYDLEHRSEYFLKYGEAEFEQHLEADIVRLFES